MVTVSFFSKLNIFAYFFIPLCLINPPGYFKSPHCQPARLLVVVVMITLTVTIIINLAYTPPSPKGLRVVYTMKLITY